MDNYMTQNEVFSRSNRTITPCIAFQLKQLFLLVKYIGEPKLFILSAQKKPSSVMVTKKGCLAS